MTISFLKEKITIVEDQKMNNKAKGGMRDKGRGMEISLFSDIHPVLNPLNIFPGSARFGYGIALVLVALSFSFNASGQIKDKTLQNEEIDILGEFNPVISDALKISQSPSIKDTTSKIQIVKYAVLDKKVNTTFQLEPIASARMKGEPLTKLYRNYTKFGLGNYTTPMAEFYMSSLRSKKHSFGTYLRHFSSSGSINDTLGHSGFSNNKISLFGKTFIDKHTLSGVFDYDRNVVHYYGFNNDELPLSKSDIRQRFNLFTANAGLSSNYSDSARINHIIDLRYYNLNDIYNTAENNVNLDARLTKYHGKELMGINTMVDYYQNTTLTDSVSNVLVKINPEVISTGKKWRLKAGMNIFFEGKTNEVSLVHFYPNIDFNFNVIDNILIPYAGVTGKMERNSFKSSTDINPFLNGASPFENTNHKLQFYGGIRGSLSSTVSFNTFVSHSNVQNMAFFINDSNDVIQNKFSLIYDDVKLLNIHGELAWQKLKKLRLSAKADYYKYTMFREMFPWHKPEFELTFSGTYNLRDKIIVRTDVFYTGSRYGKSHFSDDASSLITGTFPVILKGVTDINLGIEYRYTKHLSAFINFNNIGAARYNRWYNYPTQRFNLLGGFTYSF